MQIYGLYRIIHIQYILYYREMPLITLSGAPMTGKTTVTEALVNAAKLHYPDTEVHVINFESLKINRNIAYKDMNNEKKLNGILRTAVERMVTMKRLVILDGK
jgi:tRNA uridine 5-carbamoylmethylation protein Kti12